MIHLLTFLTLVGLILYTLFTQRHKPIKEYIWLVLTVPVIITVLYTVFYFPRFSTVLLVLISILLVLVGCGVIAQIISKDKQWMTSLSSTLKDEILLPIPFYLSLFLVLTLFPSTYFVWQIILILVCMFGLYIILFKVNLLPMSWTAFGYIAGVTFLFQTNFGLIRTLETGIYAHGPLFERVYPQDDNYEQFNKTYPILHTEFTLIERLNREVENPREIAYLDNTVIAKNFYGDLYVFKDGSYFATYSFINSELIHYKPDRDYDSTYTDSRLFTTSDRILIEYTEYINAVEIITTYQYKDNEFTITEDRIPADYRPNTLSIIGLESEGDIKLYIDPESEFETITSYRGVDSYNIVNNQYAFTKDDGIDIYGISPLTLDSVFMMTLHVPALFTVALLLFYNKNKWNK